MSLHVKHGGFFFRGVIMIYGLATVKDGIIFKSWSLEMVLEQMNQYPDAYIVELEEKKKIKKNYSEDFLNELR